MNGGGAEREGDTESETGSRIPSHQPRARRRARTHGPRDRDLAEVGRLTDCATQAPLIFFLTFIYFWDRERQSMNRGGAEREKETQNQKQAPGSEPSAQSPTQGSNSRTVRSWPELKSDALPTEPPRRPPNLYFKQITLTTVWGAGWSGKQAYKQQQQQNKEVTIVILK